MTRRDYIPGTTRAAFLLVLTFALNISRECLTEAADSGSDKSISCFVAGDDVVNGQWVRPENCQRESHGPQNQLTALRLPAANKIPIFLIAPASFERFAGILPDEILVSLPALSVLRI